MAEFPAVAAAVTAFTTGRLPAGPRGRPLDRVCAALVSDLDVDGASISVGTDRPEHRETAGTSDDVASLLEELQYDLGVGPCFDAVASGRPVLVGDVAAPADTRWPALTPGLVEHGVRALWAVPLSVGASSVGVAEVYRRRAGLPTRSELDALRRALAVALPAVLALPTARTVGAVGASVHPRAGPAPLGLPQAIRSDPQDVRSEGAGDQGSGDQDLVSMPPSSRARVHQATGMVVAQLRVAPAEALARLRAHAWAQGRPLTDVCTEVIGRELRLGPP